MRDYIYRDKGRVRLLLLLTAVILVACSDDSDTVGGESSLLQLVPYSQEMAESSPSMTRAVSFPDGYSLYEGPNKIGVYATTPNEAPDKVRTFSYMNNAWNSQVSVTNGITYYIYGYMPASSDIDCDILKLEGTGMDFSNGAVLKFSNLPPVMAGDFSVVTGVKQVSSANPTETVSLEAGLFSYEGKPTGSNFVCLMLNHLYPCVSFKFLVEDAYSKLRTIKLKKVELKTETQYAYPLTVTLRQKTDPVPSGYKPYTVQWGNQTSMTNDYVTLFTSEEGELLPMTNNQTVDGFFAPFQDEIANTLVLRCTYDVYDKNITTGHPDGNLVRANCVAENKLPENRVIAGGNNQYNKRTTITLTVNPTYLYVLSEPDLDNPTITINN